MNKNWFSIPIYHKDSILSQQEIQQLSNGFLILKENNLLKNYNGTSLLNYDTNIFSALDYLNLNNIKEKIRLYCNDYLINCNVKFRNIEIEQNWLIGYNKNEYQGEHNHGYKDNHVSGVVYIRVPASSSPITFLSSNPFSDHIVVKDFESVNYIPTEGMILIFPSFLKHKVLPNINITGEELRLGLSFNARVTV